MATLGSLSASLELQSAQFTRDLAKMVAHIANGNKALLQVTEIMTKVELPLPLLEFIHNLISMNRDSLDLANRILDHSLRVLDATSQINEQAAQLGTQGEDAMRRRPPRAN